MVSPVDVYVGLVARRWLPHLQSAAPSERWSRARTPRSRRSLCDGCRMAPPSRRTSPVVTQRQQRRESGVGGEKAQAPSSSASPLGSPCHNVGGARAADQGVEVPQPRPICTAAQESTVRMRATGYGTERPCKTAPRLAAGQGHYPREAFHSSSRAKASSRCRGRGRCGVRRASSSLRRRSVRVAARDAQ